MIIAHYGHRLPENFQLSTNEPNGNEIAIAYQILHLAQPLLDMLPKGDDR
jgi:hypothetical protein